MASIKDQLSAHYEPPAGMSPAVARVQSIGGYDTRTFAVAILSLVQDGFVGMESNQDGGIRLTRRDHAWLPRGAAAQWLLKALVEKGDLLVGRQNYVRLLSMRRGHADRLLRESNRMAGNGGMFIMAGFALVVLLSIGVAAVMGRAPVGMSALDALAPFWPVPLMTFGGLWIWRRLHVRGQKRGRSSQAADIEGYRRYIEVAQAGRLDPKFMADGAFKSHDPDTVYVAAFGFENAWADPLVHLLESLLPAEIQGTPLDPDALTEKRGFAPRKQPGAIWQPAWFMPWGSLDD